MRVPSSPFTFVARQPLLVAGLVLLAAVVVFALVGPLLYDTSLAGIGANRPRRPPGGNNPLGTDAQGRDILAALILATPQTLKIGVFAGVIGLGAGVLLGLVAGFFRGLVDAVIRTVADVMMTIPGIAVLVLVATNVRTMSVALMALIVAGLAWMYPTRTIRAQTLSMRERPYVDVARINGIGGVRLVLTEILPNLLPYIAASFVTAVSSAMLATIGLEALGLGPQNELTLGMMIYWAQYYGAILRFMWWWWVPPVAMLATIFIGLLMTSAGMDRLVNARLRVES
jgi:peptide/nickel transport system permease protein